jgi:hypothetical protein
LDLHRVGRYVATSGRIGVSGQFAYCRGAGLDVIDVSNPAQPKLVQHYDTSNWLYGLPTSTNFKYVPDAGETWMVYDVSNLADPKQVGGYKTIASGHRGSLPTAVAGTFAYVSGPTGTTLQIIDIRNPVRPQRVGAYDLGSDNSSLSDLVVSGTFAYLAAGDAGLQILDVSSPSDPVRRITMSGVGAAASVAVDAHYAFVGGFDGLRVIDIRDPAKPQVVARYSGEAVTDLAVSGNYACLGGVVVWPWSIFRIRRIRGSSVVQVWTSTKQA